MYPDVEKTKKLGKRLRRATRLGGESKSEKAERKLREKEERKYDSKRCCHCHVSPPVQRALSTD